MAKTIQAKTKKWKFFKVKTKNGKDFGLLDPSAQSAKYAHELRTGQKYTNTGVSKNEELSIEDRQFRHGYLAAQKANAKAYKSRMKNK